MDAVIYTRSDEEYALMREILQQEAAPVNVCRDPLDGHGHYDYAYDLVVVALPGAEGMETVLEWQGRYPDTQVIWISDDPYFAGMAIRCHVGDFILRPLEESCFRSAVRRVLPRCPRRTQWHYRHHPPDTERSG